MLPVAASEGSRAAGPGADPGGDQLSSRTGTGSARRTGPGPSTVTLMGVTIHNVSQSEVVSHILGEASQGRGGCMITPNVDILRLVTADPELAALVRAADLVVADGMPVMWAARLQGTPLCERVPASEAIHPLCAAAAQAGVGVFLLGAPPGVAERAAAVLAGQYAGLEIGHLCPPMGFEKDDTIVRGIHEALRRASPGIVFCGFGFPKQERLMKSLHELFPGTWFIGSGGTFSMVAGDTPKAPVWMRRAGLEWAHRLRLEPARLFERYIVHDLPFAFRLLLASAANRLRGRSA